MKFVNPWILISAVPVLIIASAFYIAAERRKLQLLAKIPGGDSGENSSLSRAKRRWKFILLLCGMVLLLIAGARPYIHVIQLPAQERSRDILVLFDVSKSMLATDLPPDRMAQAKFFLRDIIKSFPSDRFGIVPFAGNAFLSCPLTSDHHALMTAVNELDISAVPVGGTDLSKALKVAIRAFAGSEGDHRAILLLTDGDQLSGDALKLVPELKKLGIPVVSAGFGSPDMAAPVPGDNGGVMHSASGEIAGTRLDEKLLQQLSAGSGGIYIRSTVSDTGVAPVKKFLSALVPENSQESLRSNPDDLFPWFIGGALLIFAVSGAISERKKVAAFLLIIGIFLPLYGEDPADIYRQAVELQRSGDPQAVTLYSDLISGRDTPELLRGRALQNLAVVNHSAGRENLVKCRQQLALQNTDGALQELEKSLKEFESGSKLYTQAMNFAEKADFESGRTGNFQQLLLDRQEAEKLKKAIEELKKLQQQAKEKTENAQQKNQDQKQSKRSRQQSSSDAAKAAENLQDKAEKLGQKELAKSAADAAKDLKEAEKLQEKGQNEAAEKKLQSAADKLGKHDKKDKNPGKSEAKENNSGKEAENSEKQQQNNGTQEKDKEDKAKKDSAARKLDMLEDEAQSLRDAIRNQQLLRRRPVQKDW
ncbi:MAG: VWA domain-containing protein [Lentisphaeria bacterium]|nr:VWA domain-containing protein [Lentisphaeria bacterium]